MHCGARQSWIDPSCLHQTHLPLACLLLEDVMGLREIPGVMPTLPHVANVCWDQTTGSKEQKILEAPSIALTL